MDNELRDDPDTRLTGNSVEFSAVEELDEAVRAFGWNIEYRQMRKGKFSAEVTVPESDGISLASVRFDNHLHIDSGPPEGFIAICMPSFDEGRFKVSGKELIDGDILVYPPRSGLEVVTNDNIRTETLYMPEVAFRVIARSLVPDVSISTPGSARIIRGDPGRLAAIQREMRSACRAGVLSSESASYLLTDTILWMDDALSTNGSRRPSNGAASIVARRARMYIEANLGDTIRMEDLCVCVGAGLRTIQRCFASQFQINPSEYIKARRLNVARRILVTADSSNHTVTSIAMDSGFSHLGRFSVDYHRYFGESPRETLSRID
jgi:AraC-like DNA-binding protein